MATRLLSAEGPDTPVAFSHASTACVRSTGDVHSLRHCFLPLSISTCPYIPSDETGVFEGPSLLVGDHPEKTRPWAGTGAGALVRDWLCLFFFFLFLLRFVETYPSRGGPEFFQ